MYNGELLLVIGVISLLIYGLFENKPFVLNQKVFYNGINFLMILTYLLSIFLMIKNPLGIFELNNLKELTLIENNFTFSTIEILVTNEYLSIIKALLILITIPFLIHRYNYELTILITTSLLGMLLLISSTNLLAIYLALELQSLSAYLLAAYNKENRQSTEAGLKYFVLGALASGLILFGISLIYGFTGLINLDDLKLLDKFSIGAILGAIFLSIGFLFKLGAVPFHGWLPDVYEGSPMHIMGFFATLPKLSILILLIRIFNSFYGAIETWQPLLLITSILSIIIGSLGALYQQTIKRLLAYSAIANVGFILMGLSTGSLEGLESSIIYSIIYMITNLGLFTILLAIKKDNFKLSELQNLGGEHSNIAVALSIFLFSTAGLPPLAGFYGKLQLFIAAINESLYLLVLIGIIMSVISTAYYIRLIQIMFFQPKEYKLGEINITINTKIVTIITLTFVLMLLLNPGFLLKLSHEITLSLI